MRKAGFNVAKAGFNVAKAGFDVAKASFDVAKASFDVAKAGFNVAKAGFDVAKAGFNVAKAGFDVAKASFDVAKRYLIHVETRFIASKKLTRNTDAINRRLYKECTHQLFIDRLLTNSNNSYHCIGWRGMRRSTLKIYFYN